MERPRYVEKGIFVWYRLRFHRINFTGIISEAFVIVVKNVNVLFQIPTVTVENVGKLRNGSLVRFQCMVQDVPDPEFFMATYRLQHAHKPGLFANRCGLLKDTVQPEARINLVFLCCC